MNESILMGLRSALLDRHPLTALPKLVWKRISALNTWGTNAIEGSALTREDVEGLLFDERTPKDRSVTDVLVAVQHDRAFRELVGRLEDPIGITTALELHGAVFWGVRPDAGTWRGVNVRIPGSGHGPPSASKVVALMEEWELELARKETGSRDVFETAAWMHYNYEAIHPFSDGNGRVGRLLLNLYLLKHSWPPVHVLPDDRDAYISFLERGRSGDLEPLEAFLRVLMGRSLIDLVGQVGTAEDEPLPLKHLAEEGPYDAKYLALRAMQGELPAVKRWGRWFTSRRAMQLYQAAVGRG